MRLNNTPYSGKRKRKTRRALPAAKTGAIYVRSTLSCGARKFSNTSRDSPQYTRRANRKARRAGFEDARGYAQYLLALYEYAKKLMPGGFK